MAAGDGTASVRFVIVARKIGHPAFQFEYAAVFQFCVHFAIHAMQYMSFTAPVVGYIARRVPHFTYTDIVHLYHLPESFTHLAGMLFLRHIIPTQGLKGKRLYLHMIY